MLMLFLSAAGNVAAATYTYTLDIEILQAGVDATLINQIGMVDFNVYGGDYVVTLGDAIPTAGNWKVEDYGDYYLIFDDYSTTTKDYTPLLTGHILTITSDSELSFDYLQFSDFVGKLVDSSYYSTAGFQNANVPIPGAIVLLGSGLLGLLGFARKRK